MLRFFFFLITSGFTVLCHSLCCQQHSTCKTLKQILFLTSSSLGISTNEGPPVPTALLEIPDAVGQQDIHLVVAAWGLAAQMGFWTLQSLDGRTSKQRNCVFSCFVPILSGRTCSPLLPNHFLLLYNHISQQILMFFQNFKILFSSGVPA